ncbi:MAG: 16S rRNA (uracil(1498)-N(3))-methyltransferase [Alphaproteobacteria bacterium]|nr:MAG: 16S rRNA (uracil(1498)-N(3))-methyltransferase [Alphaproteobacteria bacterium]
MSTEYKAKTRLYLASDLAAGRDIPLNKDQAHYLRNVLRADTGAKIHVFNGRDGEYVAEFDGKTSIVTGTQTESQKSDLDVWVLFAPVKKDQTDFILQKCTELGASVLQPVFTDYTNTERFNIERAAANVIEASQQSRRLTVPAVKQADSLKNILAAWPKDRALIFCDEMRTSPPLPKILADMQGQKPAFLSGPEGGFSAKERDYLNSLPFVKSANLGPRVLRAETAAMTGLAVYGAIYGDWK